MGKITIKHYLNKNIKCLDKISNEVEHPIYIQITANRKTTQIRSLTDYLMSEKDFASYELYTIAKFDSNIEEITKEFLNEVKFEELQEEKSTVLEILDYCLNKKNIEFGKLKPLIIFYSKLIQFEFGKHIYTMNLFPALIENDKTAAIAMYLKSEMNPLNFIDIFKKTTKFDIMKILTPEQKMNIIGFDSLLTIGTINGYKLINWYNGTIKEDFIKKTGAKHNDFFNYIDKIAINLENNLFLSVNNKL